MAGIQFKSPTAPPDGSSAPSGHNGGPPLEQEHTPEWGGNGIGNYFYWKAAHRAAWKNPSAGIVMFRIRKAERLGSPTKSTHWKFWNAAATFRSRTSIESRKSSRRAPSIAHDRKRRTIQETVFTGADHHVRDQD